MKLSSLTAEDLGSEIPPAEALARLVGELPPWNDEVAARLALDLERTRGQSGEVSSAWPPLLEEPRRRADTRYADPATSHRPVVGPALVAAKRTFRLLFQPFINEMLRRQVEFNESILGSLAVLYEQVKVNARSQALWRQEVEARLAQLERRDPP